MSEIDWAQNLEQEIALLETAISEYEDRPDFAYLVQESRKQLDLLQHFPLRMAPGVTVELIWDSKKLRSQMAERDRIRKRFEQRLMRDGDRRGNLPDTIH